MFAVSKNLSKVEAVSFGRTMTTDEPWYVYKVMENPKARDAGDREAWVVCRYPRNGEIVKQAYAIWVEEAMLELAKEKRMKKAV